MSKASGRSGCLWLVALERKAGKSEGWCDIKNAREAQDTSLRVAILAKLEWTSLAVHKTGGPRQGFVLTLCMYVCIVHVCSWLCQDKTLLSSWITVIYHSQVDLSSLLLVPWIKPREPCESYLPSSMLKTKQGWGNGSTGKVFQCKC